MNPTEFCGDDRKRNALRAYCEQFYYVHRNSVAATLCEHSEGKCRAQRTPSLDAVVSHTCPTSYYDNAGSPISFECAQFLDMRKLSFPETCHDFNDREECGRAYVAHCSSLL
eukprot:3234567-Pleurochrysis_carterae.AAC.1